MARIRHALTDDEIANLEPNPNGTERTYRQFGVPGLMLRVGRRKRSWELRIEKTPPARRALGDWPAVGSDGAQAAAKAMWARHKAGEPVDGPTDGEASIATAWPLYRQRLLDDDASPKTLAAYEYAFNRLSERVRNLPLKKLLDDRTTMADEVAAIRAKRAHHKRRGQAAAVQSAVFVSALFGFMRDRDTSLLGDPVSACQTTIPKRHDLPVLAVHDMPEWWRAVQQLNNPIYREALLFCLLSGLRRESLESLKWLHLDLRRGCIHVEKAKGGADRAFDLVLSRAMIRCLWRARRAGRQLYPEAAKTWVFAGERGHIRAQRLVKLGVHANHALRRGYSTAAALAGIDEQTIGRLLNHSNTSVTAGYIKDSLLGKLLAGAQENISAFIVRSLGSPAGVV